MTSRVTYFTASIFASSPTNMLPTCQSQRDTHSEFSAS